MKPGCDSSGKLAVLVPTFNGSHFLRRSVDSCARAGLAPNRYEILVTDNCSSDGSVDDLPGFDVNGARIQVIRNERNLGRVGNWNRALQTAADQGFLHATFLFVGDEWIPGGSLPSLLDAMETSGGVLGMAPLRIFGEDGCLVRDGARISITTPMAQTDATTLLNEVVRSGRLPFAPIQANIYRLFNNQPLRFDADEGNELNADVEGTAAFLANHPGVVTLAAEPYLIWRERSGRFLTTQDPWFVFAETRKSLRYLAHTLRIPVDWKSANAIAMLAALREPSQKIPLYSRAGFAVRVFRYLWRDEGGLSTRRMAGFVWRKLWSGQSYLSVSTAAAPDGTRRSAVHTIADQCGL